jgi:hypothetical protein
MSQQNIDFGTFPDDPDADAIRTAFQKVQNNFNELYTTATAGSVTSVNQSAGAGIQVNSPTGNVVVTANIACVQVATTSLSIGQGSNGGTSAIISQTSQTLVIDINPANVFSNNFAAVGGGLANVTATLTSNSNSQPNITSVGTLTNLAVTGNITASNVYANSGTVGATTLIGTLNANSNSQPNITTIGTLSTLTVTGNSNLGNIATANIFSGDGGLLTNVSVAAGTSIINGTSNVAVSLNSNVSTSVAGNANVFVVTGTGANSNGYFTVSGNITSGNANLGNAATASYFIGSGNNLSNIQASNITGSIANATYATNAGSATTATSATTAATVTTNAQPNITSVGTLTTLDVNGTVTAVAFTANTGVFTGNGNGLTNLVGANVTGTVANATYAVSAGSATTAGTVTTNAQPNITSTGTLTSLTVSGNVTSGNVYANTGTIGAQYLSGDGSNITNITVGAGSSLVNGTSNVIVYNNGNVTTSVAGNANIVTVTGTGVNIAGTLNATGTISSNLSGNFSGNVTTAAQGNITSLGTLTGLTVNGTSNLGPVGNVTITGGSANYFLMTNGSGTLTWTSAALAPVPGSNTQVVFNDGGAYSANSNLTFNKTNGLLTATLLGGTLTTNAQPNITSVGSLTSLIVNGNINTANASVTGVLIVTANITTPQFISNVATGTSPLIVTSTTQVANLNVATAGLATFATTANSVAGANVSGAVSFATTANAVAGANVSGAVSFATTANSVAGANVSGAVSFATAANSVAGANVSGTVSSATSATTAGTVTTAAQPNITSVGTLTGLTLSGTLTGAVQIGTGTATHFGTALTTGANSTAGTITGNWSLSAGSRLNATYADLAEKYVADAEYYPGTVLVFGGEHEVTLSTASDSFRVAGVVTTNPAYTMNNDCMGEHIATIALQGRVPVKVIGPVYKGDLLVSSENGHAIANNIARAGTIIGKSLENFTDTSGVIEVAVGRF